MIIVKTPFRMSFFGGGTDVEDYFNVNGGAVISTTFDKYCYVTLRTLPPFFDYNTHLTYSSSEYVSDVEEIKHPAIREAMKYYNIKDIRMIYDSDLPAKSGLGTSSSFAVGMINAIYCLKGKVSDKKLFADEAIYLERILCKELGGWQDQIAASFGGLNRINFYKGGYEVKPINISTQRKVHLNSKLMMFFTGFTRFSSDVQKENFKDNGNEKNKILSEMHRLVDYAEKILSDDSIPLDEFGKLLHKTWELKTKTGSAITNNKINDLYDKGMKAGALGGKLLGAGNGGYLIFYVNEEFQENVKKALKDCMHVSFKFENDGTKIIYKDDL